jgi:hypothetical protein
MQPAIDIYIYANNIRIEVKENNILGKEYEIGSIIPDLDGESNYILVGRYIHDKVEKYAAIIVLHNLYIDCIIDNFSPMEITSLRKIAENILETYLLSQKDYLTAKLELIIRKLTTKCNDLEEAISKKDKMIEILKGF